MPAARQQNRCSKSATLDWFEREDRRSTRILGPSQSPANPSSKDPLNLRFTSLPASVSQSTPLPQQALLPAPPLSTGEDGGARDPAAGKWLVGQSHSPSP